MLFQAILLRHHLQRPSIPPLRTPHLSNSTFSTQSTLRCRILAPSVRMGRDSHMLGMRPHALQDIFYTLQAVTALPTMLITWLEPLTCDGRCRFGKWSVPRGCAHTALPLVKKPARVAAARDCLLCIHAASCKHVVKKKDVPYQLVSCGSGPL